MSFTEEDVLGSKRETAGFYNPTSAQIKQEQGMIVDNIKNISMYETVLPGISDAFQQIQRIEILENRRYDLKNGYFTVQTGMCLLLLSFFTHFMTSYYWNKCKVSNIVPV